MPKYPETFRKLKKIQKIGDLENWQTIFDLNGQLVNNINNINNITRTMPRGKMKKKTSLKYLTFYAFLEVYF